MSNSNGQRKAPWIIRTYAGFGSAEETNKRFRENLKAGQAGISVAFDLPTQNGYDPDDRMSRGEIGGCGVSISHLGDMERLFEGIDPGTTNTSMTINSTAPFVLALYLVLAEQKAVPWKDLRGTVQNDLMKEFVARGTNIFSPSVSLQLSTDIITFTAEQVPQWNPINVCGYHYMESGARPHEEIGYAFGNALIILDTIRPKLEKQQFKRIVERVSFFINSGIELIPEICKIRAYSQLWTDICKKEYGIDDVAFRAGCQVRSLGLTAQQPENNIIRIVLEALPALLSANARVNALQLPGFREALSLPDQMEQRLSLRTQQILMHETGITNFPDIFDGNPVITDLTHDIVEKARSIALKLRSSGYEKAIATINTELTKAVVERQLRIDSKQDIVVGVNDFLDPVGLSEQLGVPPSTAQNPMFEQQRAEEIGEWKRNRDPRKWAAARYNLSVAVKSKANIMAATLEFVRASGTVGEWATMIENATKGRFNTPMDLSVAGSNHPVQNRFNGVRIVLGKAGLDGHNNALKLIALGCRDAGMEVIFAGTKVSAASLVKSAVEEDADVLGVSCLSGAHLSIAQELITARSEMGANELKIVIGGVIPEGDVRVLTNMGINIVISTGSATIESIVNQIGTTVTSIPKMAVQA